MDPQAGFKRKHQSLSIQEKVEMLKKLDLGVSVPKLRDTYGIGSSTVYDIKKQRDKILKFYEDSDSKKQMSIRKTMKDGKSTEHDRMMMEWFRKRRSDSMDLTGNMIKDQAKLLHKELKLEHMCDYSEGWLQRFKKRHGIVLQKNGEKRSANPEEEEEKISGENVDEFAKLINDGHLNADQVCTGETALYWRCAPRKTSATTTEDEEEPEPRTRFDPSKTTKKGRGGIPSEYTNTAGTHGSKPLMKGKCKLKGVNKDKAGDANEQNQDEWTNDYDDEATPVLYRHTDCEIIDIILKSDKKSKEGDGVCCDGENESGEDEDQFSIDSLIELLGYLIKGLEQRTFVTEEELMNFYLMYAKLEREKSKRIEKLRLHEMLKKMTRRLVCRQPGSRLTGSSENPEASTSATPGVPLLETSAQKETIN